MANALLQKWVERAERRALFWWQPKNGGVNMGDHLSKVIVSCVLALQDKTLLEKRDLRQKLIATGSVLHFAKDGDTVWGSGINGKIPAERNTFSTLDVRAVRGPKTRAFLLERGIAVPEVYGDPGLLTPMFSPPTPWARSPSARSRSCRTSTSRLRSTAPTPSIWCSPTSSRPPS